MWDYRDEDGRMSYSYICNETTVPGPDPFRLLEQAASAFDGRGMFSEC